MLDLLLIAAAYLAALCFYCAGCSIGRKQGRIEGAQHVVNEIGPAFEEALREALDQLVAAVQTGEALADDDRFVEAVRRGREAGPWN